MWASACFSFRLQISAPHSVTTTAGSFPNHRQSKKVHRVSLCDRLVGAHTLMHPCSFIQRYLPPRRITLPALVRGAQREHSITDGKDRPSCLERVISISKRRCFEKPVRDLRTLKGIFEASALHGLGFVGAALQLRSLSVIV